MGNTLWNEELGMVAISDSVTRVVRVQSLNPYYIIRKLKDLETVASSTLDKQEKTILII